MRRTWLLVCLGACRFGFDEGSVTNTIADAPHLTIDAPMLALDGGECPPSYAPITIGAQVGFPMGCYRISTANASWLGAELACEADAVGAHMVVVDDDGERNGLVSAFGAVAHTWIGTSRRQVTAYRTVTDKVPFLAWGTGPGNEPSEDCVSIDADGFFYQHSCPDVNRYFCEYDGTAAVPTTY